MMTTLQRYLLQSVYLLTSGDVSVACSKSDLADYIGGWGGWRSSAMRYLVDSGYVLQSYQEAENRLYFSLTLRGLLALHYDARHTSLSNLYQEITF